MRIVAATANVVTIAATRQELGVLIAAARMALDVVSADADAPPAARDRLAAVLHDYDAALDTRRPGTGAPANTDQRKD